MFKHVYVCMYIYIYIYIYREREREGERDVFIHIYIYICFVCKGAMLMRSSQNLGIVSCSCLCFTVSLIHCVFLFSQNLGTAVDALICVYTFLEILLSWGFLGAPYLRGPSLLAYMSLFRLIWQMLISIGDAQVTNQGLRSAFQGGRLLVFMMICFC